MTATAGRHGDAGLDIGRKGMAPIYDFIETAQTQEKPFFIWHAPFLPHQQVKPDRKFSGVPKIPALYDLKNDPLEKNDLAKDHPEIVRKLKAQLEER